MIFDWWKIFNLLEFETAGLVSRTYTLELQDLGVKDIMVTKGNYVSILYEGVFLSLNMNAANPFTFEGHAIYIDGNNDVYLGIEVQP